MNANDDDPVRN